MSLCEKANNLKPMGRTAYIDAEQFKYLYGDYYSTDFMRNIDDECYFTIKYYYEDREERKGADSVWCDMYWNIDDADMPNAEQFEDECNRIKYYRYNGSSGIAMMMCGLDFQNTIPAFCDGCGIDITPEHIHIECLWKENGDEETMCRECFEDLREELKNEGWKRDEETDDEEDENICERCEEELHEDQLYVHPFGCVKLCNECAFKGGIGQCVGTKYQDECDVCNDETDDEDE